MVNGGPFRPSKFSDSRKFENIASHVHTHDGKWERIRIKKGLKKKKVIGNELSDSGTRRFL